MTEYLFEAMDNTGLEVKDRVEATSEAEAQQKVRMRGLFVTRIREVPQTNFKGSCGAVVPPKTTTILEGPRRRYSVIDLVVSFVAGILIGAGLIFLLGE